MSKKPFVVWFNEVDKEDIPLVGGKGANLGEMTKAHFPVPAGFIITAPAYYYFINENKLERDIRHSLVSLNYNDPRSLQSVSEQVKKHIVHAQLPKDLATGILTTYHKLSYYDTSKYHDKTRSLRNNLDTILEEPLVAVRSSATAEDLPSASFAGQQTTFLNIQGDVELLESVKECYASLFEARAIFYRHENKFDHFRVGIAVPVQKMVQSDASGVMFTIDPITNDKTKMTIEAVYGLGELIVQGSVTPDHYEVDKKSLHITKKQIEKQVVMLKKIGKQTKEANVAKDLQSKQKISNKVVGELAELGKQLEQHYFFPQDIEWAIEGNQVYIVQTRPITTLRQGSGQAIKSQKEDKLEVSSKKLVIILRGDPASPGIGIGPVRIIHTASEMHKIKPGDVLVAPKTDPDYVPAMRKSAAIVTDHGGRTSHAAIVSRELGIPCVVGADIATQKLKTGHIVTVNGSTGEVFKGGLTKRGMIPIKILQVENAQASSHLPLKTTTKLYVNLAEPDKVSEIAAMEIDGVGLLRAEFMLARFGVHPLKIIKEKKQKSFVDTLAGDLKMFCEHFNPRPVVYRLSDFKTNEYRNLTGGGEFEPQEENPMIGFRGAYRFIVHPETLALEVGAIKKVREEFGFKNLWVMVPYVRTVEELAKIKHLLASFGLRRNPSFKLWMMVEIPSNVILIEDFIKVGIDGISIGSNDLTMLTLGTDRDNNTLAKVFSERDSAVIESIKKVIHACHKYNISSSICGQAPSSYPDFVDKLVLFGITSISVNPDAIVHTRKIIYDSEHKLWRK